MKTVPCPDCGEPIEPQIDVATFCVCGWKGWVETLGESTKSKPVEPDDILDGLLIEDSILDDLTVAIFNTDWFQTAWIEFATAIAGHSRFTAADMRRIQENTRRLLEKVDD